MSEMRDIERYSEAALRALRDSDFLLPDDWEALEGMREELQSTFEKKQMWRTETEMRISVLGDLKHPTPDSKYWQAVKEQDVFFTELVLLSFEYRRNNIKIERLSRDIKAEEDILTRRLLEIDLEEAKFRKRHMEVAAKNRVRELKLWSKIKAELEPHVQDLQDPNTHQLLSYAKQYASQATAISKQTPLPEKINTLNILQSALREARRRLSLEEAGSKEAERKDDRD